MKITEIINEAGVVSGFLRGFGANQAADIWDQSHKNTTKPIKSVQPKSISQPTPQPQTPVAQPTIPGAAMTSIGAEVIPASRSGNPTMVKYKNNVYLLGNDNIWRTHTNKPVRPALVQILNKAISEL